MAWNFRKNASSRQKALSRRIRALDNKKKLANLSGNIKLANQIEFEIRRTKDEMVKIAYGKS